MKGHVAAATVFLLLVAVLVLALRLAPRIAGSGPAPRLAWAFIPPGVPDGAPFAAWFAFEVPAAPSGLTASVQLRICDLERACILGARKAVTERSSVGVVTATRALAPGEYDLDMLVLRPDALGGVRTVQVVSRRVRYGD